MSAVFLVYGLLAHSELGGDLCPRPAQVPGSVHLQRLELFGKSPQRRDGPQPDRRVGTARAGGNVSGEIHIVNVTCQRITVNLN
jgi:hypothetical protein